MGFLEQLGKYFNFFSSTDSNQLPLQENLKTILIYANNPEQSHEIDILINSETEKYGYFDAFQPYKITYQGQELNLILTHSLFYFNKIPTLNNHAVKDSTKYYMIYDPNPLGKGAYGSTYCIDGVWKLHKHQWQYKTKIDPTKKRLLKLAKADEIGKSFNSLVGIYSQEQFIASWTPHMGCKYKIMELNKRIHLLMRYQHGQTLSSIIKKLAKEPNWLSITQRLEISIELLKALNTQVHEVKISTNNTTIVHQDLKPENIIVNLNSRPIQVSIIDYGLAKSSAQNNASRQGTYLYADPRIFTDENFSPDKSSDFFEIAISLNEFWGNTSRDDIKNMTELLRQNLNIPTDKLLKGIKALTEKESKTLLNTLKSITRFNIADRLSAEKTLTIFTELFQKRKNTESLWIKNKLKEPSGLLNANEIITILQSDQADLLLDKLKINNNIQGVVAKLGIKLIQLDVITLDKLVKIGMDLSKSKLISEGLANATITSQELTTLLKLEAPLPPNALKEWIEKSINNELHWVSICKTLFQATENPMDVIKQIAFSSPFKEMYCNYFLNNKPHDFNQDKIDIQIIKYYLANQKAKHYTPSFFNQVSLKDLNFDEEITQTLPLS